MTLAALLIPLWIHKTMIWPLLPVGLSVTVCVAGLVWKRRWLCGLGVAILLAFSTPVTGDLVVRPLERMYPFIAPEQCAMADAAVVLGGGASEGWRPGLIEWNEASERFAGGMELYQAGRVRYLVFTRGKMPWSRARDEGSLLRAEALRRGVDAARVVLTVGEAGNTADEAREVARLVREHGWRSLVVVTSGYHMPRSMWLFRGAAPELCAYPVDSRTRRGRAEWTDWMPRASMLENTEDALHEYWGFAWYLLRGR